MTLPDSLRRRDLLAAVGSATAASVAGCFGAAGQPTEDKHQITVNNGTQKSHTVTVVIEDESGTVLLDHTFQMEPRTGDAEVAFTGTASMVTVHIDEDVTKEFPWSPEEESDPIDSGECSGGNTVALEILLIGPNFDDPDDAPDQEGDFMRNFRCSVPDHSL